MVRPVPSYHDLLRIFTPGHTGHEAYKFVEQIVPEILALQRAPNFDGLVPPDAPKIVKQAFLTLSGWVVANEEAFRHFAVSPDATRGPVYYKPNGELLIGGSAEVGPSFWRSYRAVWLRHCAVKQFDAYEELLRYALISLCDLSIDPVVKSAAVSDDDDAFCSVPLFQLLPNFMKRSEELIRFVLSDQLQNTRALQELGDRLHRNLCRVSRLSEAHVNVDQRRIGRNHITPEHSGFTPRQVVEAYFADTPLMDILLSEVSISLPVTSRLSHHHIIAGTNRGKTTLITEMIQRDIEDPAKPCVILVDPHSDAVRKLFRSNLPINDRVIYINPRDRSQLPTVNLFDMRRYEQYDEVLREQMYAGAIETLNYLFSGIGVELSSPMVTLLEYVTRLMQALPAVEGRSGTLIDVLKLLASTEPYKATIDTMSFVQRDFFERVIHTPGYKQSREALQNRIHGILSNPILERLFTAEETQLDLSKAMNSGSIILIDTAKDFLKGNSQLFGRLMISLIFQSVMERAAIPEEKRHPTYLYVDEATEFFNGANAFDEMLREARKFKCGLVLVHHDLFHASPELRASLATHPQIRFASGVSPADAGELARQMRTDPEFILSRWQYEWAGYIEGLTKSAIAFKAPTPQRLTPLSDEQFEKRLARNRERIAPRPIAPPVPEPSPPPALRSGVNFRQIYPPLKPSAEKDEKEW